MISPDSTILLLSVPISIDNKNQITFNNSTDQENYFRSHARYTVDSSSYIRKDGYIRVEEHVDRLYSYNYIMYKNSNYTNKWFYAYITEYQYVSDGLSRLYIKTDSFQTWQFDLNYKQCFIEREHIAVANDTPRI